MNDIYHLGRRVLIIWHCDGNGKRVCISKFTPLPRLSDAEWKSEVVNILNDNGLTRAAKCEGRSIGIAAPKGRARK